MEMNLISKKEKSAIIELSDIKETDIYPLVERLLSDDDVLLASYKTGHPQLDRPLLSVTTKRVNPETAVKKAAESLAEEMDSIKKEFQKAAKMPRKKTEKAAPKPKKKKALPKTKKKKDSVKPAKKKESKAKKAPKPKKKGTKSKSKH